MSLLVVQDLTKSFGGVHAVRSVDFRLERGERLAIIGPNGAGKSTCFDMVGGQRRPDAGRVLLDGEDVTGLGPDRIWAKGVGRTFQVAASFASMTVAENVQMALINHHGSSRALWPLARRLYRDEALALLDRVGMAAQADRTMGVLAYGDVKRVELAIALANEPKLLLMDEPTAGMATAERLALMDLTSRIVQEQGAALLFTEHDMDVVFRHADRILVLARGAVVAEGPPAAIRADPEVQAIYLGQGFEGAAP
ncbi:MAG: ABC transporter ATP-binding protein [Geminicoccaceae bacterium]|nr:MAG: ABC transporter ATP-binding protein [Geminicoccaceae bacterium]